MVGKPVPPSPEDTARIHAALVRRDRASDALRAAVCIAVANGGSLRATANIASIAPSTVWRWINENTEIDEQNRNNQCHAEDR